jgi:peroxiredoxin
MSTKNPSILTSTTYFLLYFFIAHSLFALAQQKKPTSTIEVQCVQNPVDYAYLIKDQLTEPSEVIVDSVVADGKGSFVFHELPDPNAVYWIRIGTHIARYEICLANNDSLIFKEDTIKKSFQLTYDRIGANQAQEQIHLIPFDSITGVLYDDTSISAYVRYMSYNVEKYSQRRTEVEKFITDYPDHTWFINYNSEGLRYYTNYARAAYIAHREHLSDIVNYSGCDPQWADTVKLGKGSYHSNFYSFVSHIIDIRLIHWNRRGIDTAGADPYRLRKKLKIVLNSLEGINRDGIISNDIAMDADIHYDASLSIPIIEEAIDSLLSSGGEKRIIDELRERVDIIKERQPGQIAKDISLPDINGKIHSLSEFRGKALFLHFWATWCGPCQNELPQVRDFEQSHSNDTSIAFVEIALESHNFDKWKKFVTDHRMSGIQLYADGGFQSVAALTYSLNYVPAYMILDRKGRFVSSKEDPPPNEKLESDLILAKSVK